MPVPALLLTSCHSVSPLTGCFHRYRGVGCIFFFFNKGEEATEEVEISSKSMGIIDRCLEMAQDCIVFWDTQEVHMVIALGRALMGGLGLEKYLVIVWEVPLPIAIPAIHEKLQKKSI